MKTLAVVIMASTLAACSSMTDYEKRAEREREQRVAMQEQVMDRAPVWFTNPPVDSDTVYATGTFASASWDLANRTATDLALGKICVKLGGQVRQQSRVYQREVNGRTQELSETAIKSMCPGIDVQGFVLAEREQYADTRGRVRVYVMIAYPMNASAYGTEQNAEQAFERLDTEIQRDYVPNPTVSGQNRQVM